MSSGRQSDVEASSASAPLVKASAFINRFEFIKNRFGQSGLDRVLSKLLPEDAWALKLPSRDWYPLSAVVRVDQAIVAELFANDVTRMAEIGAFSLENSLTRLYRFLFRVLNTETMLHAGVKAFRTTVSQGRPVFQSNAPMDLTVRFEQFRHGSESYCHFLRGSVLGVLLACKAMNPAVEKVECSLRGDAACAYRVRWG